MPFVKKLKFVQNTVWNCPAARNWRQNTLRNCRFASNWPLLLRSQSLWKTPCTTFLLLEIGPKSHCGTVVLLQIGPYCQEAKACEKLRAQLSFGSKLASKHSAQVSFCLELASFVKKLRLLRNIVRKCPVAQNLRQNTLRNCRFAWNGRYFI